MNPITRIESNQRLSRAVIHNGTVYLAGMTAGDTSEDIAGQTRQVLAKIDAMLAQAGTDKSRLLSAQIWLKNIQTDFKGMNSVWDAWTAPGCAPARATVEAALASAAILVEIAVRQCK